MTQSVACLVAKAYASHLLERMSVMTEIFDGPRDDDDQDDRLCHLRWMCEQIIHATDKWSATKMHRWIGYIQGVLVARTFSTVTTERSQYRAVKSLILAQQQHDDADI